MFEVNGKNVKIDGIWQRSKNDEVEYCFPISLIEKMLRFFSNHNVYNDTIIEEGFIFTYLKDSDFPFVTIKYNNDSFEIPSLKMKKILFDWIKYKTGDLEISYKELYSSALVLALEHFDKTGLYWTTIDKFFLSVQENLKERGINIKLNKSYCEITDDFEEGGDCSINLVNYNLEYLKEKYIKGLNPEIIIAMEKSIEILNE